MSLSATITVLVENSVARSNLIMAEHGLALLVDTGARCILFDTGQSQLLTVNAQNLKIDLDAVDTVILSHGHYDHTGGLSGVLANAAGEVAIYVHPFAMLPKYHKSDNGVRDIGMPSHCLSLLQDKESKVRMTTTPIEISPGITITGEIPRIHREEEEPQGFFQDFEALRIDRIQDDQALFMQTPAGTVVLLGCAHSGVINTLDYIRQLSGAQTFFAVIGGMHLNSASDERMAWTIESLRRFQIERLYPAHCTGTKAVAALWAAFPGQCFPCGVGTTIAV